MRFIATADLKPGMVLGRDIIRDSKLSMLKKGIVLTDEYIKYFKENGYMGIYVLDEFSKDIEIEDTVRPEVFQEGIKAVEENNVGALVNTSVTIVQDVFEKKDLSVDLFDLRSFDDYTYHHSVNVAVYAVAVGRAMNLDKENIKFLSEAAIAHDLGKSKIPKEILNKHGKLTDEEYKIMQAHPEKSVEILNQSPMISAYVKQAVLMHHENENGSGYPLHKEGKDIPLLAKIIHVVDVYDALTSRRPYKDPYPPANAYEYLVGGAGNLFDRKVLDAMETVIPAYPTGINVILSNGQPGIVARHTDNIMRPVVKLYSDGTFVDLNDPANQDLSITSSGILQADYTGEVEELNEDRQRKSMKKTVGIVGDMVSASHVNDALNAFYKTVVINGADALAAYLRDGEPLNLLIIDIDLPEMKGMDLVMGLRKIVLDFPPFMIMSSSMSRNMVMLALKAGASDFILKPVKPNYLRERVNQVIEKIYDVD